MWHPIQRMPFGMGVVNVLLDINNSTKWVDWVFNVDQVTLLQMIKNFINVVVNLGSMVSFPNSTDGLDSMVAVR